MVILNQTDNIIFEGKKHISLASLNPEIEDRTITSWGFLKTYGVAGLQIGYLVTTNKWVMARLRRIALGILRGTSNLALAVAPLMLDETLKWWRNDIVAHLTQMKTLAEQRFQEMENKLSNENKEFQDNKNKLLSVIDEKIRIQSLKGR